MYLPFDSRASPDFPLYIAAFSPYFQSWDEIVMYLRSRSLHLISATRRKTSWIIITFLILVWVYIFITNFLWMNDNLFRNGYINLSIVEHKIQVCNISLVATFFRWHRRRPKRRLFWVDHTHTDETTNFWSRVFTHAKHIKGYLITLVNPFSFQVKPCIPNYQSHLGSVSFHNS